MATIKLSLRTIQKLDDGACPIIVRVTKDRKSSIVTLPFNCKEKDWDEKANVPKSVRLSMLCNKALVEIQELSLESYSRNWSAKKIVEVYKNKDQREISFFDYYEKLKKESDKGFATIININTRINKFRLFLERDIYFDEITYDLLKWYKSHLKGLKSINRYFPEYGKFIITRSNMTFIRREKAIHLRVVYLLRKLKPLKETYLLRKRKPFLITNWF